MNQELAIHAIESKMLLLEIITIQILQEVVTSGHWPLLESVHFNKYFNTHKTRKWNLTFKSVHTRAGQHKDVYKRTIENPQCTSIFKLLLFKNSQWTLKINIVNFGIRDLAEMLSMKNSVVTTWIFHGRFSNQQLIEKDENCLSGVQQHLPGSSQNY